MSKHPVIHLLHDIGLAAWTGGSLMGAVGLNGAAAALDDPAERARASTAGWSRWAPVNAAALAAHVAGGVGLTVTEWSRVRSQKGVGTSTAIKAGLTGAGLGVAAWSAVLNRTMAAAGPVAVQGATEPAASTPPDVARAQRQLQVVQWLNPAIGLALLGATAVHEEQQRAAQQAKGRLQGSLGSASPAGAGAVAALVLGLVAARRRGAQPDLESAEGAEVTEVGVVDPTPVSSVDPGSASQRGGPAV